MSRFFVKPEQVSSDKIRISEAEAHHIKDVMRLGVGDEVLAFDGTGKEYTGLIEKISSKEVIVKIKSAIEAKKKKRFEITLVQAIPRLEKMDFIIQKATELGVDKIMPVITKRTIVVLEGERAKQRLSRWERIATEAAKQCGRVVVPKIEPITDFRSALEQTKKSSLRLLAALVKEQVKLKQALKDFQEGNISVFIGPEGDFTEEEVNSAREQGVVIVSLGELVLRAETASLYMLSSINYEIQEG